MDCWRYLEVGLSDNEVLVDATGVVRDVLVNRFYKALPDIRLSDDQNLMVASALIESLNDLAKLIIRNVIAINEIDFIEIFQLFYEKLNELSSKPQIRFQLNRSLIGLFKALQVNLESNVPIVSAILSLQISMISKFELNKSASKQSVLLQVDVYFTLLLDCVREITKKEFLSFDFLYSLAPQIFELTCLTPGMKDSCLFLNGCIEVIVSIFSLCRTRGFKLPHFMLHFIEMSVLDPISEILQDPKPKKMILYLIANGLAEILEPENLSLVSLQSDLMFGSPRLCEKTAKCAFSLVACLNLLQDPTEAETVSTLSARILGLLHRRIIEKPDEFEESLISDMGLFAQLANDSLKSEKAFEKFSESKFFDTSNPEEPKFDSESRNPILFYFVNRHFSGSMLTGLIGRDNPYGQLFFEGFFSLSDARTHSILTTLRRFCIAFQMKGESQVLERVMMRLARKVEKEIGIPSDSCFAFFCALLMLNTDLHNKDVKDKMTQEIFKRNVKMILTNGELSDELIDQFYQEVKQRELRFFDPERMRSFSPEEYVEYSSLVEKAREKYFQSFFPTTISTRLNEAIETKPDFPLKVLSSAFGAKFLASLPTLIGNCIENPDALELIISFCLAPAPSSFDDSLCAELEVFALSQSNFHGNDGLSLFCSYMRLLSAISVKNNKLARLFWNFIAQHFTLLMFGFDEPYVKTFVEKFETFARAQRSLTSVKSGISFLKSFVSDDSSEDEVEALAKAHILHRPYRLAPPPIGKLLEQLQLNPDQFETLIIEAEKIGLEASPANSRAVAFIFFLLLELSQRPKLEAIKNDLLESVGKVAKVALGPSPVKQKKSLFWGVSLNYILMILRAQVSLAGTYVIDKESNEQISKMALDILFSFLTEVQILLERIPKPDPKAAREITCAIFEDLMKRDLGKNSSLSPRIEPLLIRTAEVIMEDSPDEALFFLFELFDQALTQPAKIAPMILLLIPLRSEPEKNLLSNRLLVLLAEKILSTISTPNLKISLQDLPLLIFSLVHRLDLDTLDADKAIFLSSELLASESSLRSKLGENPLIASSVLLILSKSVVRIPPPSILPILKPAIQSFVRVLKSQESSVNFAEMELQFSEFIKGAAKTEEVSAVVRDHLLKFGEGFAKKMISLT